MDHYGLPPMVMFPSSHYKFKTSGEEYKFTLPKRGIYKDLDEDYYKGHALENEEFILFNDETNTFNPVVITSVLLGLNKYPKLKIGEVFAPLRFELKNTEIIMTGTVITLVG